MTAGRVDSRVKVGRLLSLRMDSSSPSGRGGARWLGHRPLALSVQSTEECQIATTTDRVRRRRRSEIQLTRRLERLQHVTHLGQIGPRCRQHQSIILIIPVITIRQSRLAGPRKALVDCCTAPSAANVPHQNLSSISPSSFPPHA